MQIARARLRQWAPRVEERFLAALAATCNVKAACAEVELTAASAYNYRERWQRFAERWDEAVEIGYSRLEAGQIEHAGNMLSGEGPPVFGDTPPMSFMDALQLLHMHKHAVRGVGKAPGKRWRPPKTLDELAPGIMRKLELVAASQEVTRSSARPTRRSGRGGGLLLALIEPWRGVGSFIARSVRGEQGRPMQGKVK